MKKLTPSQLLDMILLFIFNGISYAAAWLSLTIKQLKLRFSGKDTVVDPSRFLKIYATCLCKLSKLFLTESSCEALVKNLYSKKINNPDNKTIEITYDTAIEIFNEKR